MEFQALTSIEQLRALYDQPHELAVKKQQNALDSFSRQFLELSPFCLLSTAARNGAMDCSPRGDYPGFVEALDDSTLAMPDRPGNNRIDSLSNIVENPNVGLLMVVPGFNECLRVNGKASITTDADLMQRFEHKGKLPRSVVVIRIEEIYFHCAKSMIRSKLWNLESQVSRDLMPSLGKIIMAQTAPESPETLVDAVDAQIREGERTTLY